MKRIFVTLILGLELLNLTAQSTQSTKKYLLVGRVISDTYTLKTNNQNSFLPAILDSENKIEIRFITYPSFDKKSAIVLSYNKDWAAKLYFFEKDNPNISTKEINDMNLDSIFSQLVANNIFALPDEEKLTLERYSLNTETNEINSSQMYVTDGNSYVIEFRIAKSSRRYRFSNPEIYAKYFPLIPELKCYANITQIFNGLTGNKRNN